MDEQNGIFTTYERESLDRMGKALQTQAKHYGRLHKNNPDVSGLCLSLYKLGVSVSVFSKLNGHMEIWATFVPEMFSGPAHPPEESASED